MKTKWIIILLLALPITTLTAQPSQRKVLLQQIAALKVYSEYLGKGYSIAKDGLKSIGNLKDGELNLHNEYFDSLGQVNVTIAGAGSVAGVIELQQNILRLANELGHDAVSGMLSGAESAYCNHVRERLLQECANELQKLFSVLTHQELTMEDSQRLKAIEGIYGAMQDNYTFIKKFSNDIRLIVADRERSQREVNKSRQLNAIN
jgi:hypothetical protein